MLVRREEKNGQHTVESLYIFWDIWGFNFRTKIHLFLYRSTKTLAHREKKVISFANTYTYYTESKKKKASREKEKWSQNGRYKMSFPARNWIRAYEVTRFGVCCCVRYNIWNISNDYRCARNVLKNVKIITVKRAFIFLDIKTVVLKKPNAISFHFHFARQYNGGVSLGYVIWQNVNFASARLLGGVFANGFINRLVKITARETSVEEGFFCYFAKMVLEMSRFWRYSARLFDKLVLFASIYLAGISGNTWDWW